MGSLLTPRPYWGDQDRPHPADSTEPGCGGAAARYGGWLRLGYGGSSAARLRRLGYGGSAAAQLGRFVRGSVTAARLRRLSGGPATAVQPRPCYGG
ncbi:hypothetical protein LV779_09740 [Streptomyces thinghirensis]|nr:hypothetical protein [Streptomyces thinghirensis]